MSEIATIVMATPALLSELTNITMITRNDADGAVTTPITVDFVLILNVIAINVIIVVIDEGKNKSDGFRTLVIS